MLRRFGEAVRSDKHYQQRPGVYAILPRGESLLLTHQGAPHDEIQLPGGGIDHGENPIAALHREVYEETGWTISNPRKIGAYRRFCYMPEYDKWAEKICHIYIAQPVKKRSEPLEPGHTALWLSWIDAVNMVASEGDRAFLLNLK